MTVKELKEMLNIFDDDKEVVFKPQNSDYVYKPTHACTHEVRKFWGQDTHSVVICTEQTGSI